MKKSGALAILLLSVACATPRAAQSFPAFPASLRQDYPDTAEQLQPLSEGGDSYATFALAMTLSCAADDEDCQQRKLQLLDRATEQGESSAIVSRRLHILERDRSRIGEFSVGDVVCGQSFAGTPALIQQITQIQIPDYAPEPRGVESWNVTYGTGASGAKAVHLGTGPFSVLLVCVDDQLTLARVMTLFLEVGSQNNLGSDARWAAVNEANRRVAALICPQWTGVDTAIQGYALATLAAWPPRGVHVAGPSAFLAVTGVTPDIGWYDLYVDPLHQPFTSHLPETFAPASDIRLGPAN